MNRLHAELHRLYHPVEAPVTHPGGLFDAQGRTRVAVLEITGPSDPGRVTGVWSCMQVELGLPAPAIAVDGRAAVQLWCSFAEPVDAGTAQAFLQRLARHCLPDLSDGIDTAPPTVQPGSLRLWPTDAPLRHADPVPAEQIERDRWSAFVAPDLAPLFVATPWLDMPPGDAAQARVLAGLACITPAQLASVLQRPAQQGSSGEEPPAGPPPSASPPPPDAARGSGVPAGGVDPSAFLQSVLDDAAAPLALRVQAAVALLPAAARAQGRAVGGEAPAPVD